MSLKKGMETKKYLFILHIVLAVYSLLGIASKLAAGEVFLSVKFILLYGVVLFNLFWYAIVWQQIIKKIPLITAYANKAVTIIWGILWGKVFFEESITIHKIVGAAIIIIGVIYVISADDKLEEK